MRLYSQQHGALDTSLFSTLRGLSRINPESIRPILCWQRFRLILWWQGFPPILWWQGFLRKSYDDDDLLCGIGWDRVFCVGPDGAGSFVWDRRIIIITDDDELLCGSSDDLLILFVRDQIVLNRSAWVMRSNC